MIQASSRNTVIATTQKAINLFLESIEHSEIDLSEHQEKTKNAKVVYLIDFILQVAKVTEVHLSFLDGHVQIFNGKCWVILDESELYRILRKAGKTLTLPHGQYNHHEFLKNAISQLYMEVKTKFLIKEVTRYQNAIIPFSNGVLDFGTDNLTFREFQPTDYNTYHLHYNYNPNSLYPVWNQFLNDVLPDGNTQRTLQQYLGYLFLRELTLEKALFLYGPGGNGKSVVFNVISALLGAENVCSVPLKSLSKENSRIGIINKLLNYTSELHEKSVDLDDFKTLVSGEPITVRHLYSDPYQTKNYARFMFNSNHLPFISENSEAISRRLIIMPFTKTIPPEKRDVTLSRRIIESELSGVMNWVIEGIKQVRKTRSIFISSEIADLLNTWEIESNSVSAFIHDKNYVSDADRKVLYQVIYADYMAYCLENQYKPFHKKNFGARLESLGFSKLKSNGSTFFRLSQVL